ncbi:DALR anticodon-binding domain-containing protein [Yanshouia hominis]|uniref:DALR anticodon binding domain-containing protein n=1 Tax=Yanshouia hominis TaxID=2763673 RepID=A0ABR7NHR7_9FIRM|nr:hypothetical protein [Yanshouia hominis]
MPGAAASGLTRARLSLCLATRQVIRNVLLMMKIDSPETM